MPSATPFLSRPRSRRRGSAGRSPTRPSVFGSPARTWAPPRPGAPARRGSTTRSRAAPRPDPFRWISRSQETPARSPARPPRISPSSSRPRRSRSSPTLTSTREKRPSSAERSTDRHPVEGKKISLSGLLSPLSQTTNASGETAFEIKISDPEGPRTFKATFRETGEYYESGEGSITINVVWAPPS